MSLDDPAELIVVNEMFPVSIDRGPYPSAEFAYQIIGTDDERRAADALADEAPLYYDPWGSGLIYLPRGAMPLERVDRTTWNATVRYQAIGSSETGSEYEFETGGGTKHITHGLQTVFASVGAPYNHNAINVTADGVEGIDIDWACYRWSETYYMSQLQMTPAYRITLFWLTNCVNIGAWRGFDIGEVRFLGAAGRCRGDGLYQVRFSFAAQPNRYDFAVGDITGINCNGWDLLWVRYEDYIDTVAKMPAKRAKAVYVERVYEYDDLSALGLG